jgi:hypothetical protein
MKYFLALLHGEGQCSMAIISNGGSSIEECRTIGEARIAAMSPIKIGSMPIEGGVMEWREEPASKHWRISCCKWP